MTTVPFGNSEFQIVNFIANEHTPERAVRKILLQVDKKKTAMAEHVFRQKERDIRRREIKKQLETVDGYEAERLVLELEKENYYSAREAKLVDDCLRELDIYKSLLAKLPTVNREQFEASELGYWTKRLISDAKRETMQTGRVQKDTLESLEKIGFEPKINQQGQLLIVKKDLKILPA